MRILVEGVRISCSHFVEIDGEFESLHGHNLAFSAEVDGPARHGLVIDFRVLHSLLSEVTSRLDHRLVVPAENPFIEVTRSDGYYHLLAAGKPYKVPEGDVVLIPAGNSTAEEIAAHVYRELAQLLPSGIKLRYVSVEESEGMKAIVDGP